MSDFRERYENANNKIQAPDSLKEHTLENLNNKHTLPYKKPILAAVAAVLVISVSVAAVSLVNRRNTPSVNLPSDEGVKTEAPKITTPTFKAEVKALSKVSDIKKQDDGRTTEVPKSLAASYKSFALKSSKILLTEKQGENSVYSPLSLYSALGMLSASSSGKTQSEILNAMNLKNSNNIEDLLEGFQFNSQSGECDIKNSIWLNQNISYNQNTLNELAKRYRTEAYKMNFGSVNAPKKISKWVSENTRGLLELEPELAPNDIARFINSVYFKSEWETSFNEHANMIAPFSLSNGKKINCTYMNTEMFSEFNVTDDCVFAALNMKNSYTMVFALPKEGKTSADLLNNEKTLETLFSWSKISSPHQYGKVDWSVPKFKVKSGFDLENSLKTLGIKTAFSGEADFSPLSSQIDGSFISTAQHQASLSIDENGCEAAAFTEIFLAGAAPEETKPLKMYLDRPFIFAVVNTSGPLFVGTVEVPSKAEITL